jgi:hypothetical protein
MLIYIPLALVIGLTMFISMFTGVYALSNGVGRLPSRFSNSGAKFRQLTSFHVLVLGYNSEWRLPFSQTIINKANNSSVECLSSITMSFYR